MGRLKTQIDKLTHKKSVLKKQPSGRCYNYEQGKGYKHYTKGYKKRSVSEETISNGYTLLFTLLDRLKPAETKEETTNQE